MESSSPTSRRRGGRRRGGPGGNGAHTPAPIQLTSLPTHRGAYKDTREWLLERHGSVCAYCGQRTPEELITLDHVTPRRGRDAYDRRDNLVLACPGCNAAKRDLAPLAFLLGSRPRAANLLRYGAHLSHGLLDLARSLARDEDGTSPTPAAPRENGYPPSLLTFDDDESPYRD